MAEAEASDESNFSPEVLAMLNEIPEIASDLSSKVDELTEKAKAGYFRAGEGDSRLLSIKNHMLLEYIINLAYISCKQLSLEKIENDPALDRMAELRTDFEKMWLIEEKMKSEASKLPAAAASTRTSNPNDPLNFKPNPENLVSQEGSDEEEEEEEGGEEEEEEMESDESTPAKPVKKTTKSSVYVPPKISAAYYEGDETQQSRQQKLLERVKKRALSSSVLQELKKEYDTGPEEIKEVADLRRQKINEELKERTRYEEEYMTRLPMTKQQRHEARRVATVSSLSSLAKFEDISALELEPDEMPSQRRRSSKKFTTKKKKGKGFKRKRH